MSIMKRAMDFLGLGPDDAYDDYDMPVEHERPVRSRAPREPEAVPRSNRNAYEPEDEMVRAAPVRPSFPLTESSAGPRRAPQQPSDDSSVHPRPTNPRPAPPTVRTLPVNNGEPSTVKPRRFDQAQEIADRFKEGLPVIMNLENTERDVSRRLIDFASGLCYGLNGSMEKVASGVYLLKPLPRHSEY
jgi:cell division inhibitor SepF